MHDFYGSTALHTQNILKQIRKMNKLRIKSNSSLNLMSFITNTTDRSVLPEDSHLWEKYQPSSSSASFHSLALEILWCPTIGSNKKEKQLVYLRHANYATNIKIALEQAVSWGEKTELLLTL